MHIAFLSSEYPGKTKRAGGIATGVKSLAEGLVKHGHDVTVFLYGMNSDKCYEQNGIAFVEIASARKIPGMGWLLNRKKIERIVNREIQQRRIELLEAPDWTGVTALMRFEIPVLIRIHGSDTYFCHLEKRPQKWKNYLLETLAMKRADHMVAVSKFAAEKSRELFSLKQPIEVIYNGVNTKKFTPSSYERVDTDLILYVGTLIRKKGVLDLAEIFNLVVQKHPEAKLRLIGADSSDIVSGKSSTWALMKEKFTPEALKRVEYMGKVPHDRVSEEIKYAGICVFPSYAEAFPIAWLEAMAGAKAIVASDIGWAKECLVDNESAMLAHPSSHEIFANKIIDFLREPALAEKFGKAARRRVEQYFDLRRIVNENLRFYQTVVGEKKKLL